MLRRRRIYTRGGGDAAAAAADDMRCSLGRMMACHNLLLMSSEQPNWTSNMLSLPRTDSTVDLLPVVYRNAIAACAYVKNGDF